MGGCQELRCRHLKYLNNCYRVIDLSTFSHILTHKYELPAARGAENWFLRFAFFLLSHKKRKKGEEKKRLKIDPFLQSSREDLILTGNDMV
jgi:hypothetical protein